MKSFLSCDINLCFLFVLISGISVVDATTTTTSSSSSYSEFVQRKRPSPASGDIVRLKEAKIEVTPDTAAGDRAQTQQAAHVNMQELFEMMMQSVAALATSLASPHSSSQPSDQPMPPAVLQPDLQPFQHRQTHCSPPPSSATSRLNHLKAEEPDAAVREILDQSDDDEEDCGIVSPRLIRSRRKNSDTLLEDYLRRVEAREAHRDRDVDHRDDVTLFLLSLAPAMRRLCTEKQSWVRTKIQQLLHEAEFGATHF